jgi:hypothetical protein
VTAATPTGDAPGQMMLKGRAASGKRAGEQVSMQRLPIRAYVLILVIGGKSLAVSHVNEISSKLTETGFRSSRGTRFPISPLMQASRFRIRAPRRALSQLINGRRSSRSHGPLLGSWRTRRSIHFFRKDNSGRTVLEAHFQQRSSIEIRPGQSAQDSETFAALMRPTAGVAD